MQNNTSTSTELTVINTDNQPKSIIIDLNPTIGEPNKRSLDTFKKDQSEEIYLNLSQDLLLKKLNKRFTETLNPIYSEIIPKIMRSIIINNFQDHDLYIIINLKLQTYEIHTDCIRFFEFLLWRQNSSNEDLIGLQCVSYNDFTTPKNFDLSEYRRECEAEFLGHGTTLQGAKLYLNDVQSCSSPYKLSATFYDYLNVEEWFKNEILGEIVYSVNNNFFYY